jgi:hypothetical protein
MTPVNELGVIVLFAQQAEAAGFEIIYIRREFPDAVIRHGEQDYYVEFEYQASSFQKHGHDPKFCDFIICWENDWPNAALPVMALKEDDWQHTDISLVARLTCERDYWRDRALKAEQRKMADEPKAESKGTGGRPREPIDPDKVAYYLEHGPENVSQRQAKTALGLGKILHYRHRNAAMVALGDTPDTKTTIQ